MCVVYVCGGGVYVVVSVYMCMWWCECGGMCGGSVCVVYVVVCVVVVYGGVCMYSGVCVGGGGVCDGVFVWWYVYMVVVVCVVVCVVCV